MPRKSHSVEVYITCLDIHILLCDLKFRVEFTKLFDQKFGVESNDFARHHTFDDIRLVTLLKGQV